MNETSPTNKHSIISLVLGLITLLALCTAMLPVPFTGFICLPFGFIFGLLALVYGGIALNRIKKHNEKGHQLAWTGIFIGGFMLLCVACLVAAFAITLAYYPEALPVPPFLNKY